MFDINKGFSFDKVENQLKQIRDTCTDEIEIALIGNKTDLQKNDKEDQINNKEYKLFAQKMGLSFYLCSCLTDEKGTQNIIHDIVTNLIDVKEGRIDPTSKK